MIALPKSLQAWERGDFSAVFKTELPMLGSNLPLQEGLSFGSYAQTDDLEIMMLQQSADDACIRIKAGIFYHSLMPGCACSGDPTVEDTQNEHMIVLVSINRKTAEAVVQILEA